MKANTIANDVTNLNLAWVKDMYKTSESFEPGLKILQQMLRKLFLLVPLERKGTTECATLDRVYGFDYWGYMTDGTQFGFSWRDQPVVKGSNTQKRWDTFTVRKTRETGAKTEFEKRKWAIENEEPYPHYWVHSYHDKDTNEILSLALSTTEDVIDYVDVYNPPTKWTHDDKDGLAEFYIVPWKEMIAKGKNIIMYRKESGFETHIGDRK